MPGLSYVAALIQIRLFCAVAAIGGAAIFCWAWGYLTQPFMKTYYQWNEPVFSAIAVLVLWRRSFALAVGTAIFAGLWIVGVYLWMDKLLP